jgi:hypothetical protein
MFPGWGKMENVTTTTVNNANTKQKPINRNESNAQERNERGFLDLHACSINRSSAPKVIDQHHRKKGIMRGEKA